ncbi:MAG TPA: hypothetical protein VEX69_02445 [Candidatus Limnocylindria bacterium]|nr:hypothetical protein [Candidatus Limnocylindria bacterium]
MNRWLSVFSMGVVLLHAGGCSKTPTNPNGNPATASAPSNNPVTAVPAVASDQNDHDAIAEAIRKHLASNSTINMAVMDMDVSQVNVNGDQAQANADFRLKQGGTTMQMTYFLERHASTWIILRSQPGGGQFAHPPLDKAHSGAPTDSGHPPIPNIHEFFKNAPPAGGAGNPPPAGASPNSKTSP